jgi:predicted component of type VI protein secretion system
MPTTIRQLLEKCFDRSVSVEAWQTRKTSTQNLPGRS